MDKVIYFDMDGTIADVYGVQYWKERLDNCDSEVYTEASTMNELEQVCELCSRLQDQHQFKIGVISWCSRSGSADYHKEVRRVKREWLSKHFGCRIDECHIVKYGTRKDYVAEGKLGILFDDNAEARKNWRGISVNPNEVRMIDFLRFLLEVCESVENRTIAELFE